MVSPLAASSLMTRTTRVRKRPRRLHISPTYRIRAEALYGTAPFVAGASVTFGGVQVISQIRSNQKVRVHKRAQHVADYCATPPGTPHTIRIRGGEEVIAIVGSARVYVGSHK